MGDRKHPREVKAAVVHAVEQLGLTAGQVVALAAAGELKPPGSRRKRLAPFEIAESTIKGYVFHARQDRPPVTDPRPADTTRTEDPEPEREPSLLDMLVAAENERETRAAQEAEPGGTAADYGEDRGGRNFNPEDKLADAIGAPPAPEPDPEQEWADKITASIQAIADQAKAEHDRRQREAQDELDALLGIPGERALRAAPGGPVKSRAANAYYSSY